MITRRKLLGTVNKFMPFTCVKWQPSRFTVGYVLRYLLAKQNRGRAVKRGHQFEQRRPTLYNLAETHLPCV
jgi:hypothetical protein